jgi:hypothetical protein
MKIVVGLMVVELIFIQVMDKKNKAIVSAARGSNPSAAPSVHKYGETGRTRNDLFNLIIPVL